MKTLILLRGGGDLASGVALRLHHAGFQVVITELPRPLAVRRLVSFSEAVYDGQTTVEDVTARLIPADQFQTELDVKELPVLVDPDADILNHFTFSAVVDARLIKSPPQPLPISVPLHIGLGPGFYAGRDCHAVVETRRGHTLGRVYYTGVASPDSGQPDGDPRRVLRATSNGILITHAKIGEHVVEGELIAEIKNRDAHIKVHSPFAGVLRGLLRNETDVTRGLKLGDVDVRDDPSLCRLVSDKALAVGGGVLEVLLTRAVIPKNLML
jgi:xanthine dehydrogenase accessory factor